ncbi:galactose-1-phosphate uridylyltransferase [Embleya sp. NBC_00888]|uniref:galactose-1-phosphate uridylyltransferase n=1 Tax=Embleya sp. NBC_00888 TaxID=2975960 RepID=UPI00386898F7|nr:galactose-1-phosphate uridylyltransferase [Embleya sp. NBC_00888]
MQGATTRLADGRALHYYFDEGTERPSFPRDRRTLPPPEPASELRYDPLSDEWVVVAEHRQVRTHMPPGDECPLCPSTEARATEVPAAEYDVVVFDNRFPSLSSAIPSGPVSEAEPMFPRRPGVGRCEVVCFTADHDASFADLTPRRVGTVLDAWTDRTADLSRLPDVEQVFVFENRGPEIGVTLNHPHGQIYGYPFVTPRTKRVLASARAHRERTGGNLFADILAAEQRARVRLIAQTPYWTAFVPAAARWPMEIHLYPNRQVPDLPALDVEERVDFRAVYLEVLRRLDAVFGVKMPYVSGWHQAPVRGEEDRALSWLRLELFSTRRAAERLKFLAGSESGMGVFVNDVAPEAAARALRETRIADAPPALHTQSAVGA